MKHPAARSVDPVAASPSVRQVAFTLLTVALLLVPGAPTARAAVSLPRTYWDPGHSGTSPGSGGSGNWDLTTPNWVSTSGSGDVVFQNGTSNLQAYFAGTAGTVGLNASGINATYVEFDTPGYVLQDAPGTSYALTLSASYTGGISDYSSGMVTVSVPINTANLTSLNAGTGSTLAIAGNLTVGGSLEVNTGVAVGGTVVLSGNNAITGITVVQTSFLELAGTGTNQPLGGTTGLQVTNQGTLLYGASNQVPAGIPVDISAHGTINVNGQSQDQAHALGALTLASSSALDFGSGVAVSSVLAFGKSSGVAWSGTLSVYDYRGTPGVGGGVDQLFFGTDATGLTSSQLGEISFYSGGAGSTLLGTGTILSDGEVTYTPVPEPATWLGGLLLGFGAAAARWRRRQRSATTGQ